MRVLIVAWPVKIDVDGAPRFKLSTSEGSVPSVTSMKASPDDAWREILSLLVSKMTPRGDKPLSRLLRVAPDDASSTDEEAEASALLQSTLDTAADVPTELPRLPTALILEVADVPSTPIDHTKVWSESAFGLDLFGLRCPTVRRVIEGLPNAPQAKVGCHVLLKYTYPGKRLYRYTHY